MELDARPIEAMRYAQKYLLLPPRDNLRANLRQAP